MGKRVCICMCALKFASRPIIVDDEEANPPKIVCGVASIYPFKGSHKRQQLAPLPLLLLRTYVFYPYENFEFALKLIKRFAENILYCVVR